MGNSFHMGRALDRTLCRLGPVGDRLGRESCFRQVMGDEFWLCFSGLWELLFQDQRNALVVLLPRALQQRLVGAVPNQRVLEHVGRLWWHASLVHNLCFDQPAQLML